MNKWYKWERGAMMATVGLALVGLALMGAGHRWQEPLAFDCGAVIERVQRQMRKTPDTEAGGLTSERKADLGNYLSSLTRYRNTRQLEADERKRTLLMYASEFGHSDVVKALLTVGVDANAQSGDWRSVTALHLAAMGGYLGIVTDLLAAGADVEARGWDGGMTTLMLAAEAGHIEIVNALLKVGAMVNAQSKNGWTAMDLATIAGREDVIKVLLAAGADPEVKENLLGVTPLMIAAQYGYTDIVKEVLTAGGDVEATDKEGNTALEFATKPVVIEMLNTAE